MNRKNFLSSFLSIGLAGATHTTMASDEPEAAELRKPPYLSEGDCIAITSPAGYITLQEIQPALDLLKTWGLNTKIGSTIGKRDFTFGGTDEDRASDFQAQLDDPKVKAILCARGGYGMVRIIDRLDFSKLKQHPKWIIGFSDITVLHSHLNKNCGMASLHSKMCNSFPDDWAKAEPIQIETILSIKNALMGEKIVYSVEPSPCNKQGTAKGLLVGGNLKTLESLSGSTSDIKTTGKILFVEDTGEYLYSIDRMFWNLKRTGKLDHLAGLIVGGFKIKPDDPGSEFGKTVEQIVLEKIEGLNFPVCFNFPVGHQRNNFALKCGVKHELRIDHSVFFQEC
jgi:muramoyltetrapeptide carboxypeptidase